MGDDSEWMKLPTDDKVQHKVWKARVSGYEECVKLFGTLDERSPEFSKFLGLIKKMVVDSNAIAQEKALDAVLLFVQNAHVAGKTTSDVCGGIITKCLNSSRAKTREKAQEILLTYIEIEKQEIVQDELIQGFSHKQPKVVAACVQTMAMALREYGSKVILVKPLVKQIHNLLEARDPTVREEGKALVIEIYRWIGAALKPQLSNLKPVQVSEFEEEFSKLPNEKVVQTRFLRSQQDLKAKMEAEAAAREDGDEEEDDDEEAGPAEVDPYDLMDPVDILAKIPKDFYEKVEAKKWQERKEALEAVQKLAESAPKLENGDYSDLVRALRKVVGKDSNVMLVTLGAKIIAVLAKGLRKKFSTHAHGCVDTILEKFKEKKPAVVAALKEAIDAAYLTTTLEIITESCIAALDHKTPTVKAETAAFLARCFTHCTPATLPKKLLKMYASSLLKTVNDTSPDVREASFAALGTAMKVVGEKHLMPFLADVDNLKMTKIKECCENAVLAGKSGKSSEPKQAKPAAPPPAAPAAKTAAKRPSSAKPPAKAGGTASDSSESKPKTGGGKPAAGKKTKGGSAAAPAGGKSEINEQILSDESVEEKAAASLPADVMSGIGSSNWKERLASMETFTKTVSQMAKSDIPCQAFVRLVAKKPGLKDNNFQVMKLRVELITHLAKEAVFSKQSAEAVLSDLVEKIGDVKNGEAVKECLSCIAEASSLEFVSQTVIATAFSGKNPKNQAESLNWLCQAVKDFGFKVNIKPMIANIKTALGATNPAVRTAAVGLLGVIFLYIGGTLRVFFEDEKPALLALIDAEFEKVKGEKPPAPTRGASPKDAADADEDEEEQESEGGGAGINVADLVPRNDISEKITSELVTELGDKNWKIRNEALQKVTAILNEAKFITPNLGPLPEALKLRLGDSNKILVTATLNISTTIAQAMGPNVKQHVRIVGPGLVNNLGDTKTQVREAAKTALNTWVEQCSLHPFVEAEILSDALNQQNPNLRSELLGWLSEKLPDAKKLPAMEMGLCISPILTSMEDRNPAVRQKAQEALVPFMIHTGYDAFLKAAGKLKPASKDQIIPHLEKAKANVPAKPVKQKAASKATKAAPVSAPSRMDESDDEPAAPPPTVKSGGAAKASKAKVLGKKGAAAATSKSKKAPEEDTSPPMKSSNGKEQRAKDEKGLKVLKWNFTVPRQEFVEQLKTQMEPTFNKTLMDLLFHDDFKRHIKAIELLTKCAETHSDETMSNLDLILKWTTLRFFETNTSVLLKSLEYLQVVFRMLAENDYHMGDLEAHSFVPYLVNKVGDPKDNVRRAIRIILKSICKVYPSGKLFTFLLDGLKSKNSKQRTECLEELGSLIDIYGINVCQPTPAVAMKAVAQQIGDRDNSVRSAALNTVVIGHGILGEVIYKYVGNLSDKDKDLMEERIKRSAKSRPASGVKAPSPEPQPKVIGKTPRDITNTKAHEDNVPTTIKKKPGMFSLNPDEGEKISYDMPKLYEPETDETDQTIAMPVTRSRHTPASPYRHLLGSQTDVKSAIDLVISQVASSDITTCIQALAQIEEVIKDQQKCEMLSSHVDQLLVACSLQLRMVYSKHIAEEDMSKNDVIRLYKAIFATLFSIFSSDTLSRSTCRDVLKNLITITVTILLDQSLVDLDDGPQVIRTVNKLTIKIVENSNHTQTMSAFIKLLHENVASETCSPNFLQIIMKCLWRMVRMLPDIINDLNLDRILLDLHVFMKAFPSSLWKTRQSDTPLRTVKTLLHTLTKLKGPKILKHLAPIDNPSESEVESFIHKVLKVAPKNSQNNNEVQLHGAATPLKEGKSKKKTSHDTLTEIFKKIGSKAETTEGLNELYDFKQQHPGTDLEPFLKKSSKFFQEYIERGLKNIEAERGGKSQTASMSSSGGSGSSLISSSENNQGFLSGRLNLGSTKGGSDVNAEQVDSNISEHLEKMRQSRMKINEMLQQLGQPMLPEVDENAERKPDERVKSNKGSQLDDHKERMTQAREGINELRNSMGLPPMPDKDMTIDQMREYSAGGEIRLDGLSSSDEQPQASENAFTDSSSSGEVAPSRPVSTSNLNDLKKRLQQLRGGEA